MKSARLNKNTVFSTNASRHYRRFLETTTLAAAGVVALSAPALADPADPVGDYDVITLQNTAPTQQSLGYVEYHSMDRIVDKATQEDVGRLGHTHFNSPLSIITGVEDSTWEIHGKVTSTGS